MPVRDAQQVHSHPLGERKIRSEGALHHDPESRVDPVELLSADLKRHLRTLLTRAGRKKQRPGPKPSLRPNVRHRVRPVLEYWNPLHVTMRAVRGLPSFRAQRLFAAFERAVRTTRREDFRIVEFSVQNDHVHLIVEASDGAALARGMKSFSVRANRLFNTASLRGRGRVWADRYHRRDLTSARQVRNALVYCLANDKKHERVTSGAPRIDPFSSGRWFNGWTAIRAHDDGPSPTERSAHRPLTQRLAEARSHPPRRTPLLPR